MRSKGGVLLIRTGLTQQEIAARLGYTRARVSLFENGERRPGPKNRALFCSEFGIPPESWDEPATGQLVALNGGANGLPISLDPGATGLEVGGKMPQKTNGAAWSLQARAERLQRVFDGILDQLEEPSSTPQERARLGQKATQMLADIGKLTGENQEIPAARLLRLPMWRKIQAQIVEALRPYPKALAAVAKALEEIAGR